MSWIMLEYGCPSCGLRFESLEPRCEQPGELECECGATAPRVMSAPLGRMKLGEVTRGKSDPPPPHVMDTRPLADGMPLKEFKRQRREQAVKKRWAQIKSEVG